MLCYIHIIHVYCISYHSILYYRTLCLLLRQLLPLMFRCWRSPIWNRFCILISVAAKCKHRPENQLQLRPLTEALLHRADDVFALHNNIK